MFCLDFWGSRAITFWFNSSPKGCLVHLPQLTGENKTCYNSNKNPDFRQKGGPSFKRGHSFFYLLFSLVGSLFRRCLCHWEAMYCGRNAGLTLVLLLVIALGISHGAFVPKLGHYPLLTSGTTPNLYRQSTPISPVASVANDHLESGAFLQTGNYAIRRLTVEISR
jgi:hypothetical protein